MSGEEGGSGLAEGWRRTEGHLRQFVRHGLVVDHVLADHARQEMTPEAQAIIANGAVGLPREAWSAGRSPRSRCRRTAR